MAQRRFVKALSYYCGMIPKWEHPQPERVFVTEDGDDLIYEYDKQGNVCRTFNKVYLLEIRYAQDNGNK